jgi:hypothetical protein
MIYQARVGGSDKKISFRQERISLKNLVFRRGFLRRRLVFNATKHPDVGSVSANKNKAATPQLAIAICVFERYNTTEHTFNNSLVKQERSTHAVVFQKSRVFFSGRYPAFRAV